MSSILQNEEDLNKAASIYKFLKEGDSICVALRKAELPYTDYTELRRKYADFRQFMAEFYQFQKKREF